MSIEQDWTPVVLRKKQPKPVIPQNEEGNKKKQQLLSDEPEPPKTLGRINGQVIQQARVTKKLSQSDLAKKINIQANIIKDYENGNVIPNKKILRLIESQLGIKIKL
jgi:ribosome-binding protein aMBF1 (putative translation factor)